MSWRPIDLAPRDGADIVVAFRSSLTGEVSAAVVCWKNGTWERGADADIASVVTDVAFAWIELPVGLRHDD